MIFFWTPQHRYRCGPGDSIGFFRVGAAVCCGWRATPERWPRCRALAPAIGAADVVWSVKPRSSASHTCSSGGSVPQPKDGRTLCRPQDMPGTEAVSADLPGHRIEWPHGTPDSLLPRGRERKGVRGEYCSGMARAREFALGARAAIGPPARPAPSTGPASLPQARPSSPGQPASPGWEGELWTWAGHTPMWESVSNRGQIGRRSAQSVGWPRQRQSAIVTKDNIPCKGK